MNILRNIEVPTGNILIVEGSKGKLECLSLGDYGKAVNLAEKPVEHTDLLPLEEKWVITISTQYGCSMGCAFCDVPRVGPGVNATIGDLLWQVETARSLHPEVKSTKRLNIHFARMGEPTFNPEVIRAAMMFRDAYHGFKVHPVVSTMMPKDNSNLKEFIREWMWVKNIYYQGESGLQLSINTTSELLRRSIFHGSALSLGEIAEVMGGIIPKGRKITLNFAVADWPIDPSVLLKYFNPDHYIVKLTPMHKTRNAEMKGIKTEGDYATPEPYQIHAANLRKAGYDVLVFIASREEDEGRITCGNAILSGSEPFGRGV